MDKLNIYNLWDQFRSEWESGLIAPIKQQSAHLTQAFTIVPGEGEFVKMQTVGGLTMSRRKKRYELKDPQEITLGSRRFHPVFYGASARISKDDLTLKGRLPVTLATLQDALEVAASPIPDRVGMGVDVATKAGEITMDENCVICNDTDKSVYYNGEDAMGQPQGIMGANLVGDNGSTYEYLPQQPMLNSAVASGYDAYATDLSGLNPRHTNVVPVNYVETGTPEDSGLTIDKLLAIVKFYQMRHVSITDTFHMAITPQQMSDLLHIDKLQNNQYGFNVLKDVNGKKYMTSLLGITFHITPDVPIVDINPNGTPKWVRACPVWRKQDVEFGTWLSLDSEIEKVNKSWDEWIVSLQFAYGAGRRRTNTILTVHCAEEGLRKYTERRSAYVD